MTHDAGTDLIVPLQAANGFGWSLMDGGSVASPGTLIAATACVYVSPTQVEVTFASAPTHAAASLLLFYPYGGMNLGASGGATAIGRGLPGSTNAVTDNFSTIDAAGGLGHRQPARFVVEHEPAAGGDDLWRRGEHQPDITGGPHARSIVPSRPRCASAWRWPKRCCKPSFVRWKNWSTRLKCCPSG